MHDEDSPWLRQTRLHGWLDVNNGMDRSSSLFRKKAGSLVLFPSCSLYTPCCVFLKRLPSKPKQKQWPPSPASTPLPRLSFRWHSSRRATTSPLPLSPLYPVLISSPRSSCTHSRYIVLIENGKLVNSLDS